MTPEQLAALKEVAKAASKGKWRWNINLKTKHVYLESEAGSRQIIIDFTRWGMNGATPRFNVDGLMQDAQDCAATVEGREHHAAWYQTLDHPDVNHIAAFDPTTCLELLEEVERLRALPTIVCLCGSTKFMEAFQEANLRLTIAGEIVLSVGTNTKSDAQLTRENYLTDPQLRYG